METPTSFTNIDYSDTFASSSSSRPLATIPILSMPVDVGPHLWHSSLLTKVDLTKNFDHRENNKPYHSAPFLKKGKKLTCWCYSRCYVELLYLRFFSSVARLEFSCITHCVNSSFIVQKMYQCVIVSWFYLSWVIWHWIVLKTIQKSLIYSKS